jgi:hypothetical protein
MIYDPGSNSKHGFNPIADKIMSRLPTILRYLLKTQNRRILIVWRRKYFYSDVTELRIQIIRFFGEIHHLKIVFILKYPNYSVVKFKDHSI